MRFFRRDFHPWQLDNRALIADWAAKTAGSA
jgi:predicted metal-dependent hydrolase